MIKKLMVFFFGAFAAAIVLTFLFSSGKMLLLNSSDRKTVYELRMHEGRLQHALRRGGVQLFSWSDIALEDAAGTPLVPGKIRVARNNPVTGEYEVDGFPGGTRLLVRVTDSFVVSAFFGIPANVTERIELRPEEGAIGASFSAAALEGADPAAALPFIFVAPKADGGDTFLVYHHTGDDAPGARPKFLYETEALAPGNFVAETRYGASAENGRLHVLYFSDSPVLLREIYEAGIPSEPFPTLNPPPGSAGAEDADEDDAVPASAV